MPRYSAVELIRAKRDGAVLSRDQIRWLIDGYTQGSVAEEQMAAMAMAIFFRGLDDQELAAWTRAMIDTGERMNLRHLRRSTVDKHSTGGVGDKITLPLAPLVAACGAAVPQLSGRGLGHTGGTLDKLEAIPGWRADLDAAQMLDQLDRIGAVVCAAGPELARADRKLYALRDVTGTVESIPLIASSIMSKKIAEGAGALVLDVKVGSGAFMRRRRDAEQLARRMVGLGNEAGVRTVALLTAMDTPLGYAVGKALEVTESVEVLAGGGPGDVRELTLTLARLMLEVVGIDADPEKVLDSGRAMDTWRAMISAQGGNPDAALAQARYREDLTADADGVLAQLDAMAVGVAAWRLGAGRARKEDAVQPGAGVLLHAKPGAPVHRGQSLLTMYTDTPETFDNARQALAGGIRIADTAAEPGPLILGRIE